MKKIILLVISMVMVTAVFADKNSYIPSFSVPVNNPSYFVDNGTGSGSTITPYEKRDINVTNDGAGGGNRPISILTVYIYQVNGPVVLGPFQIPTGGTQTVTIDGSPWGVYVETGFPTKVSVWTN
jgi:hypothetical protein